MPSNFVKPPLGRPLNRADPLAAGLALAWDFLAPGPTEQTGRSTATVGSAVGWAAGSQGLALSLDGTAASYLSALSNPPAGQAFSILARVLQTVSTGYRSLYVDNGGNQGLWITGGKLNYYFGTDHLATTALTTGTWYDVAVTYDSAVGLTLNYYVNGVADGTASTGGTTALPATANLGGHGTEQFAGLISYLRVYTRQLAATEVARTAARPWSIYRPRPFYLDFGTTLGGPPPAGPPFRRTLSARTGSRGVT